jgi:hypothetical protein
MVESSFTLDINAKNSVYNCYHYESGMIHLNDFITYVVSNEQNAMTKEYRRSFIQKGNTNADGTAGEAIYTYVKNSI